MFCGTKKDLHIDIFYKEKNLKEVLDIFTKFHLVFFVFIGFVMIMTITLVNMILGLAFDDIAQIRRTAHLTKLAAKVS